MQQHIAAALQGGAGGPHQDGEGGGFNPATGATGAGADEHQQDHQQQARIGDRFRGERNRVEAGGAGGDRLKQGDLQLLPELEIAQGIGFVAEVLGHQQPQAAQHDQQGRSAQHQAGVQAQAPQPLQAQAVDPEVVDHPPADAADHDHGGDHPVDHGVVAVVDQVVFPEPEAGVVVGADHVKQRCPHPLEGIADVGEAEGVEGHRPQAHHTEGGHQDAVKGGADAAHAEFVEGTALVEPMAQARAPLHKALQEGGDRHQAQAAGDDQARQHHLAQQGEVAVDHDDREAGHRDRRGDGE